MRVFHCEPASLEVCHCEPVVLRAANQNSNDCQWQSYLNVAHAGVAPSRDSLRSQSPGDSGNYRRSAKAPLADQGELSRASPASTRLRGSERTYFDNPSVMALRETAMPAPFTQGSRGAPAPVRFLMALGILWGLPHQSADWFAMTTLLFRIVPEGHRCYSLFTIHSALKRKRARCFSHRARWRFLSRRSNGGSNRTSHRSRRWASAAQPAGFPGWCRSGAFPPE